MPESQVYAVYMNFKKSGKFKTEVKNEEKYGHQMNISDMWPENLIKNMDKMEENCNDI